MPLPAQPPAPGSEDLVGQSPEVAEATSAASALFCDLREIERRAAHLDLVAAEHEPSAIESVARELRGVLESAIDLLRSLQTLDERRADARSDAAEPRLDEWLEERTAVLAPPRIADLCFAGAFELRRVLRELVAAAEPDDLLEAVETARRKLRRAVRAVLSTSRHPLNTDPPAPGGGQHRSDLQSALAVRRLYATFRRALRRPTEATPEAVLDALRYAAGALAALVSAPEYTEVRASDRALLRRLRERTLAWARRGRPVDAGLQLLDDIWTVADLLRGISGRQELRAHDPGLLQALATGPSGDIPAWFTRLDALVGLDDALDHAIQEGKVNADPTLAVAEILVRLRHLA